MSNGSSYIALSGIGPIGPDGPTGNRGITGPTGNTGESSKGNTGYGIISSAPVGNSYQISFETSAGTSLFNIPLANIKGRTGTTPNAPVGAGEIAPTPTEYTIKGTTTEGVSVLWARNALEFSQNLINYQITYKGITSTFRGLTFINITAVDSASHITISNVPAPSTLFSGTIGQLLHITKSGSVYSLSGASGNNWDSTTSILKINQTVGREVDASGINITGSTLSNENYISNGLTFASSSYSLPISGYTFENKYAKPYSTINRSDYIQSAIAILPDTSTTNFGIVYFQAQAAITGDNRVNFSPQTTLPVFGSCCLESSECIEYATQDYCDFFGGTFTAGVSCGQCAVRSCCYFNYDGLTMSCIDTSRKECADYGGVFGNTRCVATVCGVNPCCSQEFTARSTAASGKCCLHGNCNTIYSTQTECDDALGDWITGENC